MTAIGSPVNFYRGTALNFTLNGIAFDGGFDSVNGTSMNNTEGQGRTNRVVTCLNTGDAAIAKLPIIGDRDLDTSLVTSGDYGILSTRFGAGKGTVFGWFYLYLTANPTGTTAILLRLRDASSTLLSLTMTTGGLLRLLDNTGTQVGASFATSTSTLYRVGFQYTKGTGADSIHRMWVKSAPADGAFSGTPDAEKTNGTATANVTILRWGNNDATAVTSFRLAHLTLDDAAMPAVVALPHDYYVATTGNDSTGDGTVGNPYRTVDKAITTIASGDRIIVRGGTYTENIAHGSADGVTKGLATKRCVLRNYPTETVWIRGGLRFGTADYWTLRGIGFEWDPARDGSGDPSHMVQIKEKGQYPEITKCRFRNAKAFADLLVSDNTGAWVHHCYFEDTYATNATHQDHNLYVTSKSGGANANGYTGEQQMLVECCLFTGTPNGRGIKLGAINNGDGDPDTITIQYCTFYGNYGPGQIQFSFGTNAVTIDHCLFQKSESTSYYNVEYSTGSFQLDGVGNTVTNCYGYQSKGVVHALSTNLTDGGGNVYADPVWDSDYFPSLAALLSGGKPQFGHLVGLSAASGWPFDVTATPTLASISPSTIQANTGPATLTLVGTNFDNDLIDSGNAAVVKLDGTSLTTTFVTSTGLTASIPNSLLTAGTKTITVTNPRGANTSGGQSLTVSPPPTDPFISTLSPTTKTAGDAEFTLTVTGVNFDATCQVKFGGTLRTTHYTSSTQIEATIPAAAISSAGSKDVIVTKTGANDSNTVAFTVSAAAPILSSLSPTEIEAGSSAFTLTVNGSGFDGTSTVKFNGTNKTTGHTSSTVVTGAILAADIVTPGVYPVTVNLPTGESSSLNFTVLEPPDAPASTPRLHRYARGILRHLVLRAGP